jgi:DNA-directed RNA polymerase alpha subunit
MTDDDLPTSIGRPALGALRAAGMTRLSEVARRPEKELLALHGLGPKAVRLLRAELARRGLELPGD